MLHVHDDVAVKGVVFAVDEEVVGGKTSGSDANATSAHYVFDVAPIAPFGVGRGGEVALEGFELLYPERRLRLRRRRRCG